MTRALHILKILEAVVNLGDTEIKLGIDSDKEEFDLISYFSPSREIKAILEDGHVYAWPGEKISHDRAVKYLSGVQFGIGKAIPLNIMYSGKSKLPHTIEVTGSLGSSDYKTAMSTVVENQYIKNLIANRKYVFSYDGGTISFAPGGVTDVESQPNFEAI